MDRMLVSVRDGEGGWWVAHGSVPVSLSEVPVMKHYANCREWSGHWARTECVHCTQNRDSGDCAAVWILDSAADLAPTSFYVQ